MSEVFITYNITISGEELGIITEMVEKGSDWVQTLRRNGRRRTDMEGAIVGGILEQILDQAKGEEENRLRPSGW